MKLEPAKFEKESFELYKKYCRVIHNKKTESANSYEHFLCMQTLKPEVLEDEEGNKLELGCFHMKYFIKEQLVAVGVVDILHEVLSNVYFFYDPDYKKLSLGVFGTLQEIEYIKKNNKNFC